MSSTKWDLSKIYESFESEKYQNDQKKLDEYIEKINEVASNFSHEDDVKALEEYLKLEEEITKLFETLAQYSSLQTSTNVNDTKAEEELNKLVAKYQQLVAPSVKYSKFIKKVNVNDVCQKSAFLNEYKWNLTNDKKASKHNLSDKEELIMAKYNQVSGDAWSNLQSKLTSNLKIKVKGFDKTMPLAEVRNLAYSNDPVVRKNCYDAEIKCYSQVEDSVAMALNNIKRQANIESELRGYKSVIDMTCEKGHMKKKTLDALISAIEEELPTLRSPSFV